MLCISRLIIYYAKQQIPTPYLKWCVCGFAVQGLPAKERLAPLPPISLDLCLFRDF